MTIYLIDTKTKKVIHEYSNVVEWGINFVEYDNYGRAKIYCSENECFTDKNPEETITV